MRLFLWFSNTVHLKLWQISFLKPRWRPGIYSILYIHRRRGTGVSVANTFKGFFHRRFLITNHAWRARISVRPKGNFIQFFSRWICRFYHFNFAVKCWHHSTAKAKPFLYIIYNSKIFWSIFCPSSTHGVNDGFFQKQLFNRLDFSRFLLFSTFSMARCQGPQNSVWTPVLNTRMHFIHCFDYSRPFLCSRKMEIILIQFAARVFLIFK